MAKIKVVIDAPTPSKEVINRYKYRSENKLVKEYQRLHTFQGIRRLFHKNKLPLYIVVVLLIVLLFLLWGNEV